MATQREKITFLNGKVTTLTSGEINAIERYASENGTDPERTQYDPGYVNRKTLQNLIAKGIFVLKRGMPHFVEGLLPTVPSARHSGRKFTLSGALLDADQPAPGTYVMFAEDLRPGYRYWAAPPEKEHSKTIKTVSIEKAHYHVLRAGVLIQPTIVTIVYQDNRTKRFFEGEKVAVQGPWKGKN